MYSIVVVTLESSVDTPVNCHQIISSIMFHGQLDIGVRKNQSQVCIGCLGVQLTRG